MDILRDQAAERARSVENKASFLVVAAGILVPTALTQEDSRLPLLVPFLPLALTFAAIVLATVALWPRKRLDLEAQTLYDRFYDSEQNRAQVEAWILTRKVAAATEREQRVSQLARFSSAGFICLTVAVAALLVNTITISLS